MGDEADRAKYASLSSFPFSLFFSLNFESYSYNVSIGF